MSSLARFTRACWAQVRKDVGALRLELLLWLLFIVLATGVRRFQVGMTLPAFLLLSQFVALLLVVVVSGSLFAQEPVRRRRDRLWAVLPVRSGHLLTSKGLVLLVLVVAPAVLSQALLLRHYAQEPIAERWYLLGTAFTVTGLCVLSALVGIYSARRSTLLLLSPVFLLLIWILGAALSLPWGSSVAFDEPALLPVALATAGLLLGGLALRSAYRRRPTPSLALGTLSVLALAPVLWPASFASSFEVGSGPMALRQDGLRADEVLDLVVVAAADDPEAATALAERLEPRTDRASSAAVLAATLRVKTSPELLVLPTHYRATVTLDEGTELVGRRLEVRPPQRTQDPGSTQSYLLPLLPMTSGDLGRAQTARLSLELWADGFSTEYREESLVNPAYGTWEVEPLPDGLVVSTTRVPVGVDGPIPLRAFTNSILTDAEHREAVAIEMHGSGALKMLRPFLFWPPSGTHYLERMRFRYRPWRCPDPLARDRDLPVLPDSLRPHLVVARNRFETLDRPPSDQWLQSARVLTIFTQSLGTARVTIDREIEPNEWALPGTVHEPAAPCRLEASS